MRPLFTPKQTLLGAVGTHPFSVIAATRHLVHASSMVAHLPRSNWVVPAMTVVIVRSKFKQALGVTLGRAGAPAAAAGACPRSRRGPIQRAP